LNAKIYVVKKGDSLSSLALQFYGRASLWPEIFALNAIRRQGWPPVLTDPNQLRIGLQIFIPNRGSLPPMKRHPAQRTFPKVAPQTAPAVSQISSSGTPRPLAVVNGKPPLPANGAKPSNGTHQIDLTHLNSCPFKYELDVMPPIKTETAEFQFEATYKGQIYIWVDKQISTANITQKGFEVIAKAETDNALGKMVNSGKISVDWVGKKVTYENLMTINARGAPPSNIATGFVVDSTNPNPALRVKFSWPQLSGKLMPDILYIATNLQIVLDIRKKIQPPQSPGAQPVTAPAPNFATNAYQAPSPNFATGASPNSRPAPVVATAAGSDRPWWDRPSILYTAAAVIVTASVAADIFTLGLDAEKDPFTGAAALSLVRMAATR
jgi:hypothetical protein